MNLAQTTILDNSQILQKIRRMAYEIYEDHFDEDQIFLVGIEGQGYVLAQLLLEEITKISPIKSQLIKIIVDKQAPSQSTINSDYNLDKITGYPVVLVDDVLYTGRTLAYSLKPFLQLSVKSLRVAVLINRSHTVFPVQPRYIGYELATTLSDHIEVKLLPGANEVYIR